MEKNDIFSRFPKRKCNGPSLTIPDASLSVRVLMDRVAEGKPINSKISRHVPLPPDGPVDDDFETGTEEILDVTDAVQHAEKIRAEMKYVAEEKEKALKESLGKTDPTPPDPAPQP